ncbi:Rv3235 family protein [Actinotalea sp. JY-7876]|uniref:Rv3235 family protein n=2 Tax=unclassified Actinotalea TaxID=2638618 RepID=UPI0015F3B44B|nr:Rv3235 family protein [Actinotalea sp. JY-7876]
MSATALTRPARPARPPHRGGGGLRLLLPPSPEPAPQAAARAAEAVAPLLRCVTSPVTESLWPVAAPAPVEASPSDPARLCGAVVLAAVESLAGGRPVLQLARWVSPAVFEQLSRRCPAAVAPPARRPTVRSTVVSRVSRTVAEASVVVHDGTRVRAAAVRMELRRGAWRATVLQIG